MVIARKIIYSDINREYRFDSRGHIMMSYNAEAVRDSVLNILCTMKGERMFFPEFGSELPGMLFSPITANMANFGAKKLKRDIETWENRAVVDSVNFKVDAANRLVGIQVVCHIPGSSEVFEAVQEFGG